MKIGAAPAEMIPRIAFTTPWFLYVELQGGQEEWESFIDSTQRGPRRRNKLRLELPGRRSRRTRFRQIWGAYIARANSMPVQAIQIVECAPVSAEQGKPSSLQF